MTYLIRIIFANYIIQTLLLLTCSLVTFLSLLTYRPDDPSFNFVTHRQPHNIFGYIGSHLADFLYQFLGFSSFIFPFSFFIWSMLIIKRHYISLIGLRVIGMICSSILLSTVLTDFNSKWLPAGSGGAVGIIIQPLLAQYGVIASVVCVLSIVITMFFVLSVEVKTYLQTIENIKKVFKFEIKMFQLPNFSIFQGPSFIDNHNNQIASRSKFPDTYLVDQGQTLVTDPNDATIRRASSSVGEEIENIIEVPKSHNEQDSKSTFVKHRQSIFSGQACPSLPNINLLKTPSSQHIKAESNAELKENAESLVSVLDDFGVRGQIINVSQGPVVTLYELEPAPGTKSSRVVGLSDDIARSLSALSTRIAVVAGRNALGIELPNKQRAFFCLRELIETPEYQNPDILLPLILGKDLAGKPYVADLAKMPHLLVAGTTGSGKSVAINTMIMSLLYRYTPAECRMIMIDPKMLELSVYDNIPHLLTPVVTDSSKAVIALKWAVKEMESRYRLMSNIGVRNIAGYNLRVAENIKEGKEARRVVQTGFDPESGKPIYESILIEMEKLPFIVVIVDEMADLMIVAGKDIESSIQRLAQMARAAGIHIIMATQRPSVDVITGVIKANFPSRISFKVTSKIDSRTILGEQGAEQLLGMGDMLYMGNSSKITRVHGPFVDDNEVESVTSYLRSLGTPEYISAVTENTEDDNALLEDQNEGDDDESIYKRAKQIVKLERKVSISYIQRCLRIGYNRAANIVDRMEREGIVSAPSHTGKREILLPED
ncbi:MAG: DNA translocase FtsK [Rickettsiaceae bacterium]|nr:MAG: DNA translocase FtsK [Rickettsiaceae bacterium]